MNNKQNIRKFVKGESVEYYVLLGIESGHHQSYSICQFINNSYIRMDIKLSVSQNQISSALQRLKSKKVIKYNSRWDIV